jgi:hypothetical protein
LSSVSRFIISVQVFESSAPVGSSAKIILGFNARALAILTLCCCHPESSFGLLFILSQSQTLSKAFFAICILFCFSIQA